MPGYNTGPGQDNYGGMDGKGNPRGGNNPYGGGSGGLHSNYTKPDDTVSDDTSNDTSNDKNPTTHKLLDAIFNPDLDFKLDLKQDYLDRVYGRIPDYKKRKFLDSIDYEGDFESYLDEYGDSLYDQQNITFKDLASIPGQVVDYFQGIPNAVNTNFTNPSAYKTLGENIFSGIFANPATTVMGMNPLGLPLGMFATLMNKGPFTQKSIETGNYADLTNAPPGYRDQVLADMKSKAAAQGLDPSMTSFSPEQMAQMSTGFLNQQQQQAATTGPADEVIDPNAIEREKQKDFFDSLTDSEQQIYDRLIDQGYGPTYAQAYLGMM